MDKLLMVTMGCAIPWLGIRKSTGSWDLGQDLILVSFF